MPKGTGGFLKPEETIKELSIKQGMRIADFGCGAGYFTIPLAEMVGQKGKVYAFDILKTALESVRSRAKSAGLLNIETVWSNLETLNASKLKNESIDLVLLANILFQSSKKADIIKEAKRILKRGGKLVVIEWKKNQVMGPPEKFIVDKDLVRGIAEKQDFKFDKEFPAGQGHWGMIFVK